MSNTLKFGTDGKWAVKEGSALAYNDTNGNYKPLPFTFVRDTIATRVNKQGLIEVVPNNEPRIDFSNDSNGALLLEPSRSNLILKSDDVLSTYQSQNGNVSDASEPINGFNNSIQIEYDASNSLVYKRDFNPTIGTEYTISLFVQMNDNSEPIHTVDANSGDFCLTNNGIVVSDASDIKTERLGSTNVYRVSATRTTTSTNNRFGIIKYSTQSSKGFKVTGFQLEQGYPTSYIPTQGSIGTRDAESSVQTPPDGIINSSEGVLYYEALFGQEQDTSRYISINDNTSSNRILIGVTGGTSSLRAFVITGGVEQAQIVEDIDLSQPIKVAISYKKDEVKFYKNGILVGQVPSVTFPTASMPSGLSDLDFSGVPTDQYFYGNCKDLRVYNQALTDQELINLTKI